MNKIVEVCYQGFTKMDHLENFLGKGSVQMKTDMQKQT